jgi:hypothetical protein
MALIDLPCTPEVPGIHLPWTCAATGRAPAATPTHPILPKYQYEQKVAESAPTAFTPANPDSTPRYAGNSPGHTRPQQAAQRPHLELYVRWMQEIIRRFKPSTVSRRFSVAAGFYRTREWCRAAHPGRPPVHGRPWRKLPPRLPKLSISGSRIGTRTAGAPGRPG